MSTTQSANILKNKVASPDEKRGRLRREDYAYMRELKDPCMKEHELTMKCLDDSGYDRAKCEDYFVNYRICRKFWTTIERERKKKGIFPHLPPPDERASIKKEYRHLLS